MAERLLPEAALWTMYKSAIQEGREDVAIFYEEELKRLLMQKAAQSMQPPQPEMGGGPMPMAPPNGAVPMGAPPGIPPDVLPGAMMGVPPPMPTAPVGPSVPEGTPRPGAQTQQSRLSNLGLIPPAS